MIDPELRLPNTHFRAVFNLGGGDSFLTPPANLPDLDLTLELGEDEQMLWVYAQFEAGALHIGYSGEGPIELHFHRGDGPPTERGLWGRAVTASVIEWMTALTLRVYALMPDHYGDVLEAAAWHDEGYPIYVCESDPADLDLIEVELEGEMMTLPWLGSGSVDHNHIEGDHHPIELLWNAHGLEPDVPIARAWLNPGTDEPNAVGLPGVNWVEVGLTERDTVDWLEGIYLNHHVIADPVDTLFDAVLRRIGGLDPRTEMGPH